MALGTAFVCGAYNLAAWLVRRQRHLAINAVLYGGAVLWEVGHVRRHLDAVAAARPAPAPQRRDAAA